MVGHRTMVGLRKKSEARILATREIKRQKTSGRTKFRFNNMFFFFAPCISRENGKKLKNSLERNGAVSIFCFLYLLPRNFFCF